MLATRIGLDHILDPAAGSVHTFMHLAIAGRVECTRLISHRVCAVDAPAMYQLLDERPQDVLLAVLDFRAER